MSTLSPEAPDAPPGFEGTFTTDPTIRQIYATDASVYEEMPLAVALPKSEADLAALIRLARERMIDTKSRYLQAYQSYESALSELNRTTMWDFQNNKSLVTEEEINAIILSLNENNNE